MKYKGYFSFLLALAFIALSCQEATEPSDVAVEFPITLRVQDQAGNAIKPPVPVSWKFKDSDANNILTPDSDGITYRGAMKFNIADTANKEVIFTIDAPADKNLYPGSRDTTITAPCGAFDRTVTFLKNQRVTCSGGSLDCDDIKLESEMGRDTTKCMQFTTDPSCPTITLDPIALAPNNNVTITISPSPVVPPGGTVEICFTFSPTDATPIHSEQPVQLMGRSGGNALISCDFTVTADVKNVTACDCPLTVPQINFPQTAGRDTTVCIGSFKTFEIPMTGIRNDNTEDCDLILTYKNEAIDGSLDLPGSQRSFTIPRGSAGEPVEITFTPTTTNQVKQTIRYSLKVKSKDGRETPCNDVVINLNLRGVEPACEIDFVSSTLFKKPENTVLDFEQCVDLDEGKNAKDICFKNPTSCPVNITVAVDPDIFTIDGFSTATATIPAGEEVCFRIKFLPKTKHITPGTTGTVTFNTKLRITGCITRDYDLKGVATILCQNYNQSCLPEWGRNNYYFYIELNRLTNAISRGDGNSATVTRDIYIDTFNEANPLTNSTVVLKSDYLEWRVIGNIQSTSVNDDACNILTRLPAGALDACESGAGLIPGTAGLSVGLWDVVLFKVTYTDGRENCGIAWFANVTRETANNSSIPSACIQVCYPLAK